MNVWEFLGLPSDHRSNDKVTMNVKHFAEVSSKNYKPMYLGLVKEDGISGILVRTSDGVALFTRTGNQMQNVEVITRAAYALPVGVYLGEVVTSKEYSLEELGGAISSERVNPLDDKQKDLVSKLQLKCFDLLFIPEFLYGVSTSPKIERLFRLDKILSRCTAKHIIKPIAYTEVKFEDIESFAQYHIDGGEEGCVFSDPVAEWVAGHKGWRQFKVVRGVHLDLECKGVIIGTGKFAGLIAGLCFKYKGKPFTAGLGKGWTDEVQRHYSANRQEVVDSIWHVYGLQVSSKGVIRLPKVAEKRIDKVVSD
jgi:ATP-dependent DNA ligase